MKFVNGNRKIRDQWSDNIVDTQNGFNFRNTNPHSDGTNYPCKYNESASDSDTSPQFQLKNQ